MEIPSKTQLANQDDFLAYQPTIPDLRQLSLRAAVVCAVRSALRAQKYIEKYADGDERKEWQRSNSIGVMLSQMFCRTGLNKPSQISDLHEGGRWTSHSKIIWKTRAFKCGELCFAAAAEAAFEPMLFEGVALWSTGKNVIGKLSEALGAAIGAAEQAGEAAEMIKEINYDYERLLGLCLGVFPEIGACIDPGEEGPLGPFWHQETPSNSNQPLRLQPKGTGANLPRRLYKYVTEDTLIRILESGRVRCSPLSSFNDPFDCQIPSLYRFGRKEFLATLRAEAERLLNSETEPNNGLNVQQNAARITHMEGRNKNFSLAVAGRNDNVVSASSLISSLLIRSWHKVVSKESLFGVIDMFENSNFALVDYDTERRVLSELVKHLRVFCVSETSDNILMWSHYGELHRGAVIEFDSVRLAEAFNSANVMRYHEEIPDSADLKSFVHEYLGLKTWREEQWRDRLLFSKAKDWSYEKEWRFTARPENVSNDGCLSIPKEAITGVYLGCRFDTDKDERVISAIEENWKVARIYLGYRENARFSLSFAPIRYGIYPAVSPPEHISRLRALYTRSSGILLDIFNNTWRLGSGESELSESILYEVKRLRCSLGENSTPEITAAFRKMVEIALTTTISKQPDSVVNNDLSPDEA